MQRFLMLFLTAVIACSLAAKASLAHAVLDHAIPSVGGTVSGSPRELRLYFTQGVVAAFSHVHVVSDAGSVVPTGKLVTDSSDKTIVIVRLGRALPRGTYTVTWVVVSVDTHTTQGTFSFTVS
ncbi:MAG: copper homeostasis periplasmic binding protein CopC [Methylocella sp.]